MAFSNCRLGLACVTQLLPFDDFKPDHRFAKFFERNLHFVDEVSPRFCALRFAIVWCRSGA